MARQFGVKKGLYFTIYPHLYLNECFCVYSAAILGFYYVICAWRWLI